MGDAVIRVRGHLQALARENWAYVEEKHVHNVSWLRDELKQIALSLDLKARIENKPPVAPAPYPSPPESIFKSSEPAKKKQKTESRREDAVPIQVVPKGRRTSARLSMRMRTRAQSVEPAGAPKSRKRGRPSEDLLQDPGKLKVMEMRSELKKRGLRTSGVKAVLLDRLLDALEKEQKEVSHLIQVEEEQEEEEAEVIVIDDDEDEIVRESVGSSKSPRSQSPPKVTEEEEKLAESATEGKPDNSEDDDVASTTGPSSSASSALGASEEDSDRNQRVFQENEHATEHSTRHGVEFAIADSVEELITHDGVWTRKSMQLSGKSELTSPLAWKRKSILRKASSLAPTTRMDRKVSFAPNEEVNMIAESSQADSTQPDPSPEQATSIRELHTPREENKQARSESLSDAEVKTKTVTTPVPSSSTSTTPEDRPMPENETEEQRRKREFDETVQREAEKLRAAAKLSAQKRLEEAKASKAFWAKRDQLKAKLRASYADEKRKSAHTPVALSEKPASDQISPPTSEISTAAESNYSASNTHRPIYPASEDDTRPQHAIALSREDVLDNDFMRSMARHQVESISDVSSAFESSLLESKPPRSTYSVVEDKLQAERSMDRVADKPTAKSMPLSAGKTTEPAQLSSVNKTDNKSDRPVAPTVEPLSTRDRSDSVSSTVSSIPEPSVVENALKSSATTAAGSKRKPIANLVSGLHSFTTLLKEENPQESNSGRSAPVVNALKLAERSRVAEEKKRLEKEKRKAILKQKMEEHKKAAALKEKTEKDAQVKREQERLNERKKREAELARRRQQKLKEMRAGLEKKRAMLAAEKKSKIAAMASISTATSSNHKQRGLASASDTSQSTAKPMPKPVQKTTSKVPPALASTKSAPVSKPASKPLTKTVSRPPMTSPAPAKQAPKSHSPEIVNYEMSDNAESSDGDSSDSDSGRHGKKKVPRWAQRDHLNKILHAQFGQNATNPSPAIFHDFVDTCNLEAIFETTDIRKKKKFARRTSSGNWLADRPTARDKALYQRDMGYDR
ncbi:hypothetical protein V7S43_013315 [Phytophthora oleae]|uniref:SAP domain-containing protein n=1 Tax=Phytophthora oleae TaxID=2107226 RepID=A0ABD3F7W7_9STRA